MFLSTNNSGNLCKFGCGQICNPGFTARGNPFDTCCKSCAISQGSTSWHDVDCRNRNATSTFISNHTSSSTHHQWTASHPSFRNPSISGTTPMTDEDDDVESSIIDENEMKVVMSETDALDELDLFPNNTNKGILSVGGNLGGSEFNNTNTNSIPPQRPKSIISLDPWMIALDYESLSKLTTAQLMQRLKSHNLPHRGLKHELIERWRTFKLKEKGSEVPGLDLMETD